MYHKVINQWITRGYDVFYAENEVKATELIRSIIPQEASISLGGSVTLDQLGVVELLQKERPGLFDRYADMTTDEREDCFKNGLTADWLVTGTNAITEAGELINVDGNGNRVAPLIYGTNNVLIVVGRNKIVSSIEDGIERVRKIAPMNARRLQKNMPCTIDGVCHDCQCTDRICNATTIIHNCYRFPKRIKIILVDKDLGY